VKHNLSTRLIVRVGIPAALLFVAVIFVASQQTFRRVVQQTERSSRTLARHDAARLEIDLSRATKIPEMLALGIETGAYDTGPKVESYLRSVVARNREIYGSCVAFEPHGFSPEKQYYAPYFYWMDGEPEFAQLGTPEYDYFKWEWYRAAKEAGRPRWSEPYFDEGGGNAVMTTYSVPFRREGNIWGIATIDIALSQLIKRAESITVGTTGYAFIVSRQGRFLAYPDKSKVMRSTIHEVNPELARRMTAGDDGFLRTQEPVSRRNAWVAFVPVHGGEFSLAIVYPQRELIAEALRLQIELLVLGLIGLVVMFVTIIFIARSISRPIANLAHAAQQVAAGELDHKLETDTPIDEVRHLTFAFNKMTRDLRMRMEELRYTTTVKERLEGELSGARAIQMSLVPKRFPAFPDHSEIDVHAVLRPAREVGGDFYDFYFLDEERLCILLGDVSGKGIPAALFMAVTKTLLKANSSGALAASEIVGNVNHELCADSETGMFVTLLFAVLDIRTGEVEVCNAGHVAPLVLTAAGQVEPIQGPAGPALGLISEMEYPVVRRRLSPGDTLFFYTDGVTEALDPERNFYSASRLKLALTSTPAESAEHLTGRVVQDVRAFCGEREQSDDISVLAVRWLGPVNSLPAARADVASGIVQPTR